MKNVVFEITHANWGEVSIGSLESTVFKIYDDLSVDVINSYMQEIEVVEPREEIKHTTIKEDDYKKLSELMEHINDDNRFINACDGDAWEFIYYKNNEVYIKRDMGYIYGIKVLEDIQSIVLKLF